jgi:hypothetical protein
MVKRVLLGCAIATLSLTSPALGATKALSAGLAGMNYPFLETVGKQDLKKMTRAGVRSIRLPLDWSHMEARKGSIDWTRSDQIVGAVASRGIATQLMPHQAPLWANGRTFGGIALDGQTRTTPPVGSPAAEQYWQSFLTQTVERYGPGGSFWSNGYAARYPGKPPVPVRVWQIWNEPNIPGQFGGAADPVKYAELVKISNEALKTVDPNAIISLAGLPGLVDYPGWYFLHQLYQVPNFTDYFDLVAAHPYTSNLKSFRRQMDAIREVMRYYNDLGTGVWISEMGWGSKKPDGHINKGLNGQASYLTKTMKLIVAHQSEWGVAGLSWFDWRDPKTYNGLCTWCPYAGLVNKKGKAKPAFTAYRTAVRG